jgi:hypothetical protein
MKNALIDEFEDFYDPLVEKVLRQAEKAERQQDKVRRHRNGARRPSEEYQGRRRMTQLAHAMRRG